MTMWEFKLVPGQQPPWRWRSLDPDTGLVLKVSRTVFGTLYECVKDAEMNGYKRSSSSPPQSGVSLQRAIRSLSSPLDPR